MLMFQRLIQCFEKRELEVKEKIDLFFIEIHYLGIFVMGKIFSLCVHKIHQILFLHSLHIFE